MAPSWLIKINAKQINYKNRVKQLNRKRMAQDCVVVWKGQGEEEALFNLFYFMWYKVGLGKFVKELVQ